MIPVDMPGVPRTPPLPIGAVVCRDQSAAYSMRASGPRSSSSGSSAWRTSTDSKDLFRTPDALAYALTLAARCRISLRRRAPVAVLLDEPASLALLALLNYQISVQSQFLLVGAFTVGHTARRPNGSSGSSDSGSGC